MCGPHTPPHAILITVTWGDLAVSLLSSLPGSSSSWQRMSMSLIASACMRLPCSPPAAAAASSGRPHLGVLHLNNCFFSPVFSKKRSSTCIILYTYDVIYRLLSVFAANTGLVSGSRISVLMHSQMWCYVVISGLFVFVLLSTSSVWYGLDNVFIGLIKRICCAGSHRLLLVYVMNIRCMIVEGKLIWFIQWSIENMLCVFMLWIWGVWW